MRAAPPKHSVFVAKAHVVPEGAGNGDSGTTRRDDRLDSIAREVRGVDLGVTEAVKLQEDNKRL